MIMILIIICDDSSYALTMTVITKMMSTIAMMMITLFKCLVSVLAEQPLTVDFLLFLSDRSSGSSSPSLCWSRSANQNTTTLLRSNGSYNDSVVILFKICKYLFFDPRPREFNSILGKQTHLPRQRPHLSDILTNTVFQYAFINNRFT